MWWIIITLTASAVTPEELNKRLEDVKAFRSSRLVQAPQISPEEYKKAAKGDVPTGLSAVPGYSAKKAYGLQIVNMPIGKLFAAVNDDMGKLEHTRLGYAKVLSGTPCESGRRVFQYLPLPMVSNRWWVSDFTVNEELIRSSNGRVREVTWESVDPAGMALGDAQVWADKGIPVTFNKGSWFLIDIDGSATLVEYFAWSDPGGYLPSSLTNSMAAGGIKSTIDAVRKVAEEGTRCPIQ